MARTVLPIVGAVVGAYFGAPQVGYAIGAVIGNAVDPIKVQGPRIGETGAQTTAEGIPRPIIYGTISCTGNVIFAGPLVITEEETQEGKGGGPVTTSERCFRTYAIRICEGQIAGVLRIWEDDKLVYDMRQSSTIVDESILWASNTRIYMGSEDQLPDSALENVNPDMPAYRGTAYIVFDGEDLTDRRGSIPQYRFEVSKSIQDPWDYTWTSNASAFPIVSYSLAEGGDGRLAVTTYVGDIYESDDGATWTQVAGSARSGHLVLYSPVLQRLVAPCGNANFVGSQRISYRQDGGVWQTITPSSDYPNQQNGIPFSGGCWAGDRFVIVSSGTSGAVGWAYSLDGIVWTNAAIGSAGYQDCDYSPTLGIIVGVLGTKIGVSSNGAVSWTNYTFTGGTLNAIRWVPELSKFVACGGSQVAYSSDGINWTLGTFDVTPPASMYTLAWSPERQQLVVPNSSADGFFGVSSDGVNWVKHDAGVLFENFYATGPRKIVWSTGLHKWVYVGATVSFVSNNQNFVGGSAILGDIVSDIVDRCGLNLEKIDVTELTDEVAGLLLAGDYTGADAINTLRAPYFFDGYNADKKLWFPKRGANAAFVIDIDDLTEDPDLSKREQPVEYPKKIHLQYQHANSGYAVVKATSARSSPDARVVGESTVSVPIVLNEDQAAQTVQKMHKVAWAEADGDIEISLPDSFIKYTPSDVGSVTLRGTTIRRRIENWDYADGVIKWKMKKDRQSAYTSDVQGVPVPDPTPPPGTITGATILAVLDIPSRIDTEDDLNIYYGVTGAMPAWYGAMVQRSIDGGANYTNVVSISQASIMGFITNAITDASEHLTDMTNTITVDLYRDGQSLDSLTNMQFLQEGGAFALEKPDGTWEIMQYRDAIETSNGDFVLSTLHRGRLNSGTSAHDVGATFVMLQRPTHVAMSSGFIGVDLTHRAPSFDQSPELAAEQTATYVGRSQIEWEPVYLELERDLSDTITATWIPRYRFGNDAAPVDSINARGFRITLDDGSSSVTFDTTSSNFTYDASAMSSPLTVSVSAINRITGPGPEVTGSV